MPSPRPRPNPARPRALLAAVAPVLVPVLGATLLTGCGGGADGATARADGLVVLASFYPLAHVAEQVGGDDVAVRTLTPPGAEPHDLELSPRQAREVAEADVVVTLGGFQPAVDEVVAARTPEHHVDAADVPEVAAALERSAHEDDEHDDAAADDGHDGHEHAGGDPHVWLDPTLLAAVGHAVADALADADPDGADRYAERAAALATELDALDADLRTGLASCERDVVVVPHEAFGHLTDRYGLEQVGLAGLDPDAEPSPARVREVRDVVAEHGVTTLFLEPGSNGVGATLAADLGLATAVLDPLETQVDESVDYVTAMRRNLAALQEGLGCR